MQSHDLTRKAQSDASTFLLGREEWNEYLILAFSADRKTVVCNADDCLLRWSKLSCNYDIASLGLNGILDQIDEYLSDLSLISIQDYIFRQFLICAHGTVHRCLLSGKTDDPFSKLLEIECLLHRRSDAGEISI